jgi:ABC-2 type transport system ATP-binding protein
MAIINSGRLLYNGEPLDALSELEGRVWKKRVTKIELEEYRKSYTILSVRLVAGMPEIHVLSEAQPDSSFQRIPIGLDDVYFAQILGAPMPAEANA